MFPSKTRIIAGSLLLLAPLLATPLRRSGQCLDRRDELLGPMIVDAVLEGGEQAEMGVESEDVAGIEDRATVDAALQQVHD